MHSDDRSIAISANFTAEAIQPGLAFWAAELGLDGDIRFAGYNQLFQQLLDPGGLFARNRGFNVALLRLEDWLTAGVEASARKLVDAIRHAAFSAPLILAICPATPEHAADVAAAERLVRQGFADLAGAHIVEAVSPVSEIHDPHANELGHLPYTPEFFAALATAVARKIHAISVPPYKVIALDADDTLWSGICGEDGPQGVVLDAPRRALQEFMAERRRDGMLLALASKNNEEDVIETFRAHPEMPLRLEDFAARRINWENKADSLRAIAEELGLALDSIILVDDNPKECDEARAGAPEALTLPLPARAEEIPEFLRNIWAFDRARVTDEDRRRAELYAQRAARSRAEKASGSLEEFLASLRLEIRIEPVTSEQAARVAQLTQRTNQMNTTCVRRTEAEIRGLAGQECLAVSVKDRFGDYGLTGAIIFRIQGRALLVDTFLLSCRALGRGVEHRMVARLGEIAMERGLERVEIPFVKCQRNRPAELFLESVGGNLSAEQAAAVRYRPGQPSPEPVRKEETPSEVSRHIDYIRIANDLRTPEQLLEQIRAASHRPVPAHAGLFPPRTPLERELAELWAGLLNVPAVGIYDNFFDLGGHSLLAVQLLARVRQLYGVEISLEVVYSGEFTVAELAKAVELKEIEQAGGDYQDLVDELDALSDEEARALLEQEQGG